MPFPLVLVVAAGASLVVQAAVSAAVKDHVNRAVAEQQERLNVAYSAHKRIARGAEKEALRLGQSQASVAETVLMPLATWLEEHAQQVRMREQEILAGFKTTGLINYVADPQAFSKDLAGVLRTTAAGALLSQGAQTAVYQGTLMLGTASTGTAIGTLHGAAAQNAALAAIGGGAKAVGGGGIAAGIFRLNVITAIPGALITGIVAIKTKTDGDKHIAEVTGWVDREIAQLSSRNALLRALTSRTREVRTTLDQLTVRARSALSALAGVEFDDTNPDHIALLQRALITARGARDVATVAVADDNLTLDGDSWKVVAHYRKSLEGHR